MDVARGNDIHSEARLATAGRIARLAWIGGGLVALTVAALIVGITLVSNGASSESIERSTIPLQHYATAELGLQSIVGGAGALARRPEAGVHCVDRAEGGLELWIQPLDSVDALKTDWGLRGRRSTVLVERQPFHCIRRYGGGFQAQDD